MVDEAAREIAAAKFLKEMKGVAGSGEVVETATHIYFWKPPSIFDQWTPCRFESDEGIVYCCTEQYMMAEKALLFGDTVRREQILAEYDPRIMIRLGKEVENFNQTIWDCEKVRIVTAGNTLKFGQNPDLREKLLATSEKTIVEASPQDKVWGIGLKPKDAANSKSSTWPGQNLLGKVLMTVRTQLQQQQDV
jgi:ribA/ribD-fused uncharacterized protein